MSNENPGEGGSYLLDPKTGKRTKIKPEEGLVRTGKRTLIKRTLPSPEKNTEVKTDDTTDQQTESND